MKNQKTCSECEGKCHAKGLCSRCYHRHYQRKKHGYKRTKNRWAKENYNVVLELVKKGHTIKKACLIAKICKGTLYNKMTPQQKQELIAYKLTMRYEKYNILLKK